MAQLILVVVVVVVEVVEVVSLLVVVVVVVVAVVVVLLVWLVVLDLVVGEELRDAELLHEAAGPLEGRPAGGVGDDGGEVLQVDAGVVGEDLTNETGQTPE